MEQMKVNGIMVDKQFFVVVGGLCPGCEFYAHKRCIFPTEEEGCRGLIGFGRIFKYDPVATMRLHERYARKK